jgi:cytoskeletal protein RodZ
MPDIDWGQVIFLILFVVVGFFRWLGNLIQQQKEAKERPTILTPQDRALREAAWRKQTGQEAAPVPLPSPTSTAPPPDPFAEIKDLFKQIKESNQPSPRQAQPPPPLPVRPNSLSPSRKPQPPNSVPPPVPALPKQPPTPTLANAFPTSNFVDRSFTEAVAHRDRRTADSLMRLRMDLRSPLSLRRAIVIREILGPPKALAED